MPHLEEAAAAVAEAAGGVSGWRPGRHVILLHSGLGGSQVGSFVCGGWSSAGQKTGLSYGAGGGNSCFGHSL